MVRSRGHVFTGISRKVLLNILQRRCRALGVRLEFEREVRDVGEFEGADLIIGADGINGLVRRTYGEFLKPQIAMHPTKYVWLGRSQTTRISTDLWRVLETTNCHASDEIRVVWERPSARRIHLHLPSKR